LLYVKPSFLAKIPADVRAYGAEHKTFPHESTLDQWFSESQFESYRMLGRYQMAELVGDDDDAVDLAAVFTAASRAGKPKKELPPDNVGCDGIRVLASVIARRIGPAGRDQEGAAAAE
jgi:hypothetical protein